MVLLVDIIRALAALNLLLLLGLAYVWGSNWWDLRSKHALGLMLFAVLLIGENALTLYFFVVHPVLTVWIQGQPSIAHQAMLALRLFEFGSLVFLSWITWD